MLIWLSRQSTSLVRMRSPVRIRVLAPLVCPDTLQRIRAFLYLYTKNRLHIIGIGSKENNISFLSDCSFVYRSVDLSVKYCSVSCIGLLSDRASALTANGISGEKSIYQSIVSRIYLRLKSSLATKALCRL